MPYRLSCDLWPDGLISPPACSAIVDMPISQLFFKHHMAKVVARSSSATVVSNDLIRFAGLAVRCIVARSPNRAIRCSWPFAG